MEQIPYLPVTRMLALLFSLFTLFASSPSYAKNHAQFVQDVRTLQNDLEIAFGYENTFSPNTLRKVIISVGEAQALMREIMETPKNQLSDDEREDLYGQIIRGDDKKDFRGSLARVLWGAMPDRGNRFTLFLKSFYDDFRALLRFKDADWRGMHVAVTDGDQKAGDKVATSEPVTMVGAHQSRLNQEMLARNIIVRMFDLQELANDLEKNDRNFDYLSTQFEKMGVEMDRNRFEVVSAERLAIAFYGSMVGLNVLGAYILPAVQFDWVGTLHQLLTHGSLSETPFGTAILSGASYMIAYAALLRYKWSTRSAKAFDMMKEFLRTLQDVTAGLDEKDPHYDEKRKKAMDEHKAFVEGLKNGQGALGAHRTRMMQNGYDPKNPASCDDILKQMFM